MPWKNEQERKQDRKSGLKTAAKAAAKGEVKDAAGIAKTALRNKNIDPDERPRLD